MVMMMLSALLSLRLRAIYLPIRLSTDVVFLFFLSKINLFQFLLYFTLFYVMQYYRPPHIYTNHHLSWSCRWIFFKHSNTNNDNNQQTIAPLTQDEEQIECVYVIIYSHDSHSFYYYYNPNVLLQYDARIAHACLHQALLHSMAWLHFSQMSL